MKEIINKYVGYLDKAMELAHEIGRRICEALRPVIPDLQYTVGWEKVGIDTICFWSRTHNWDNWGTRCHCIELRFVIEKCLPGLRWHIANPEGGVFLTQEEAEKVREILHKFWEEDKNEDKRLQV